MKAWLAVLAVTVLPGVGQAQNARRLTTDGDYKQHLQWSPDGLTLLMTRIHAGKMALWLVDAEGKNSRRLLPQLKEPHFDGQWSPDGKRIIYVYDELQGTDGKLRIHTCKPDGSDDKTIVPHKAFEESPRFSPDAQLILWVSTRDGNPELYTITSDGKNQKRLTSNPAFDLHPAWMPDGKSILFSSGRTGRQKLYRMNADGTEAKPLTSGEGIDSWPTPSPDGKRIVFSTNRTGNSEIFSMDADGQNLVNLTDHPAQDTSPAVHPSGKSIAFVSTRDGGSDVYIMGLPLAKSDTIKPIR